jgi:hypothetical protein
MVIRFPLIPEPLHMYLIIKCDLEASWCSLIHVPVAYHDQRGQESRAGIVLIILIDLLVYLHGPRPCKLTS